MKPNYKEKFKKFSFIKPDLTLKEFGYEYPLKCYDPVIVACQDCGKTKQMLQYRATSVDHYYCSHCAAIRRENVCWPARLESLLHYNKIETIKLCGEPKQQTDYIIITCSLCAINLKRTVRLVWYDLVKKDFKCTDCYHKSQIGVTTISLEGRKSISNHKKAYWKIPENIKNLKEWLEKDAENRGNRFKKLNTDPEFQKKRLAGFTEESKRKQSEGSKKLWVEDYDKMHNACLKSLPGRIEKLKVLASDPLVRSQMSVLGQQRWKRPEYRKKQAARWPDEKRKEYAIQMRKEYAEGKRLPFRGKETEPELIIRTVLSDLQINFIAQFKNDYYDIDFYLPDLNIFIEVDGLKWHHPKYVKNNAKKNISRDKHKTAYFLNLYPDHEIERFWDYELEQPGFLFDYFKNFIKPIGFDFNDVVVKDADKKQARIFCMIYHYTTPAKYHYVELGAFLNEKLIAVAEYSYLQKKSCDDLGYKDKEVLELNRFCVASCYDSTDFRSWFLTKTLTEIKTRYSNTKAIVTTIDTTVKHNLIAYKKSKFRLLAELPIAHWYQNTETGYLLSAPTLERKASKLRDTVDDFCVTHKFQKVLGEKRLTYIFTF